MSGGDGGLRKTFFVGVGTELCWVFLCVLVGRLSLVCLLCKLRESQEIRIVMGMMFCQLKL